MAKFLFVGLMLLIIASSVYATEEKFVLWESFEDIRPPAWPLGWTVENTNGDDKQWETRKYGGLPERHQCVRYSASSVNPADDWFFTPGITFNSGITYTLSFRYKVSPTSWQKMNIWLGSAQSSSNMTTLIYNYESLSDSISTLISQDFTVGSSGVYYIGFHCYSNPNQLRLFIDDILISYTSTTPELEITIISTKKLLNRVTTPVYSLTDTMEFYFIIENVGAASLNLNTSFNIGKIENLQTELSYIVIEPDGDTMPLIALITPEIGSRSFKQLDPGKTTGRIDDLQKIFWFTQTGTYTLRALYKNYHKSPGGDAFLGKITSAPVTFIVQ